MARHFSPRTLISPRRWIPLVALSYLLGGCAGAQGDASNVSDAESSPGQKCLQDASAPREPAKGAPEAISVSHILVRHKDLARPEGAALTREQACLKALKALEELRSSGDWGEVVDTYSDSGKSTQGDLGKIRREDVTPGFADAAFGLEVDELSYVVETDRGFHVILRTQ